MFISLLQAFSSAKDADRFQILPYILYFIKEHGVRSDDNLTKNKTVSAAIDYISANFLTLSGVEAVAENAFVSKEYLCSAFKRETGFTITKYINNLKLNYACHLLLTSDKSITEVATESGFNSITYFGRIFKEEIKTTPLQYRKNKTE
ncbi:MAG: AraC family transcriptional regulator [Clostridia bacterium]|nr:AraC family transcriptional regulator [Clostridia bacterium]